MNGKSDKNIDRFERKAIMEAEKRKKPGECMKYMQALIDEDLIEQPMGSKILSSATVACKVIKAPIPRTILWRRGNQQLLSSEANLTDKYEDEDVLLHFMLASELVTFVSTNNLSHRINEIKSYYSGKKLTLLVFGLKEFIRTKKQAVDRHAIEMALTELQIINGVCHRHLDTGADVAQVFLQFSKSIGEKLYKKDREEKCSDQNFYVAGDNKDCVPVVGNIGLTNLWKSHLCKFHSVTLDTAEAILKEYPSSSKLIRAYQSNDTNNALLLADIPIRRAGGASATARKIGAEISQKIHSFYTNSNPGYVL